MRKNINSVIHAAADADFSAFTYNRVVIGPAAASPTVNGTTLTLGASSSFEIVLRTISATPGVYVLGYPNHLNASQQIL